MPRKASLSRTFVSSKNKIHGATSGNRSSSGPDHLPKTNVHLNTTKLQDLRQMIAIRENELKLKSSGKNKSLGLASHGTCDAMNFANDMGKQAALAEPKEPEKKRLKITEPRQNTMGASGQEVMPPVESMLASKNPLLENDRQQILENCCHNNGKSKPGTSHTIHAKGQEQNENVVPVSSKNLLVGAKEGSGTTRCQTEKKSKLAYSSIASEQNMQMANKDAETILKKSKRTVEMWHPPDLDSQFTAISAQNNSDNKVTDRSDQVLSNDKVPEPVSDEKYQASLGYQSFWKNLGEPMDRGNSNMDAKSLLDLEELQDKELEDAQEHRRQCEVEERNALKAYRNAQKALIEATARCNYLYSKRELYSAHLRNLMMNNSNLFWSFRTDDQNGAALKFSNNIPDLNMGAMPTLSCQVHTANDASNNDGSDLNPANDATQLSNLHAKREKLPSEPCSEPDGSTSEAHNEARIASGACFLSDNSSLEMPIKGGEANGVCSPSSDSSMSVDEDDDAIQFSCKSTKDNLEAGKDTNGGQEMQLSFDSSHDSLLLEASLRSQLFERLGKKSLSKNGESSQSMVPLDEGRSESDDSGKKRKTSAREKSEANLGIVLLSDANKESHSELQGQHSTMYVTLSCPVVKSVICHLKVADPKSFQLLIRSPDVASPGINSENDRTHVYDESDWSILCQDLVEVPSVDTCYGQIGSYSCNLAIDPLWPLCMYELRGKCNNDECSWQHVRDYTLSNIKHDAYNKPDSQAGSPSRRGPCLAKSLNNLVLAPPTYLVGLDVLKADKRYNSILSRGNGQCWRKCFSASMVLSSLLSTNLPFNEPFLHGTEARIEVHGAWNRQSFYFHSKNGTKSNVDGHFADNDQSLEMAFLNLNQEADKQKGRLEALKVIARALESDATSAVLWIIYLQIYYCNQNSIGKDDLFLCAVELNRTSYELWLMYINSREQLIDRLAAYDAALSALCCEASNFDRDARHASECILDIFVQMMNCLCMSGNVEKAAQKIYGLFPTTIKSDNSLNFSLADTVACFTISDACIFWVCCVYLVIYRKLPDSIVERIEDWKEISAIEWPSIHLTFDEKQHAASLMELAVDSLALYMDGKSLQNEATLRAAHLFAINHIKCVKVLEGLECSKILLKNYAKLYPSCLELVLMLARAENDVRNSSFVGFEEALRNWQDEVPGIQCIWNQYAECALRNGKSTFTKELMDRWFDSVWRMGCSQNGILNTVHCGNTQNAPQPASVSDLCTWFSHHDQIDVMFALLNFSLYKILQNDDLEALLALERALKAAATTAENYSYCVGEHVQFLLTNRRLCNRNGHNGGILKILNDYLDDAPASSEPLSRNFIQKVEKPRLRQLISKLLSPVSSDSSLVNLVLEVLCGPSLLPQMSDKLTDLVDFIETLMEIRPSNYRLAISVCKILSTNSDNGANATISFWASSLLINSLFQAVPIAPESVWVEAADILQNLMDSQTICESFLKRALSVYPFSINLWRCYLNLSKPGENANSVKEAAREKGIMLD
ncbi:putative zinc-finger domain [Forsythia ovata]|uniref:Zinc-finger domain n=1 Tax=Forsythia ovata TaxID=205694 RepID=A0ABD1WHN6_9LAMI